MTKLIHQVVYSAIFTACIASNAYSGEVKLKHFEIGMQQSEISSWAYCDRAEEPQCSGTLPWFTVGEQPLKFGIIKFGKSGGASSIYLTFKPDGFDDIKTAVTGKYKGFRCKKDEVKNAFGAKFINEQCEYGSKAELVIIKKFDGSLDTGSIQIISAEQARIDVERATKKANDI